MVGASAIKTNQARMGETSFSLETYQAVETYPKAVSSFSFELILIHEHVNVFRSYH